MTQAARSGQANISEGNSRHSTSKETEMKLTDVARASIAELAGDYANWLLSHGEVPWSVDSVAYKQVAFIKLAAPNYVRDVQHESGKHILAQKQRFTQWIDSSNSIVAANCLLILCNRLILMLKKQRENQLATFKRDGGFTEALAADRLAAKIEQQKEAGAPSCPQCGKPMIRRVAKKGKNSGNEFWSCSGYPECRGTRSIL